MTRFELNGKTVTVDAARTRPLLWVLRDHLGMTGTKFGCGTDAVPRMHRACRWRATFSCLLPLSAVAGHEDHHDRRSPRPRGRGRAERVGQDPGPAVRLLPIGTGDGRRRRC